MVNRFQPPINSTMKTAAVLVLLVAAVHAQQELSQFPFNVDPLQESLHSNKVFFDVSELTDISGVWKAINSVFHALTWQSYVYDGVTQYNLTCDGAAEAGWDYDTITTSPRTMTIEADDGDLEEGMVGRLHEAIGGREYAYGIASFDDGLAELEGAGTELNGRCRMWRPYFDWELGKTMLVMNVQLFYFPLDDGTIGTAQSRFNCQFSEFDHPLCEEGPFELEGEQYAGGMITVDPLFYECIAGPCLDLPGTLPGYVVTQGYIPAPAVEGDNGN